MRQVLVKQFFFKSILKTFILLCGIPKLFFQLINKLHLSNFMWSHEYVNEDKILFVLHSALYLFLSYEK